MLINLIFILFPTSLNMFDRISRNRHKNLNKLDEPSPDKIFHADGRLLLLVFGLGSQEVDRWWNVTIDVKQQLSQPSTCR